MKKTYCKRCGKLTTCRDIGVGYVCYKCLDDDDSTRCVDCGKLKKYTLFPILKIVDGIKLRKSICISCNAKRKGKRSGKKILSRIHQIKDLNKPVNYTRQEYEGILPLSEALRLTARFEHNPESLTEEETILLKKIRNSEWVIK